MLSQNRFLKSPARSSKQILVSPPSTLSAEADSGRAQAQGDVNAFGTPLVRATLPQKAVVGAEYIQPLQIRIPTSIRLILKCRVVIFTPYGKYLKTARSHS